MGHHCGMARLYLLLFVAQLVLAVAALISCLSAEDDEIRVLPRLAWVLIVLFLPLLGAIAWFRTGRASTAEHADGSPRTRWTGWPRPRQLRPPAPDDDPEFLRSLDVRQAHRNRELFEQWEADLHGRDTDPRGERQAHEAGESPREENRPEA